ncbi:hypothetical protein tb265_39060 [Gemmatimonadetes bacterium T265]|nr:hypothetical protein tb265_39060 [Gemmatimonadetes bacterium T265]
MKATPSSELLVLGAGELLFDPFTDDGLSTGFIHLGNCDSFSLTIATTELEMKNFMNRQRGTYKKIVKETAVTGKIGAMEFGVETLALAYLATQAKTAQAGATVTAEALTPAGGVLLGRAYKTKQRGISAVTVHKGATALAAYNAATGTGDYKVLDAPGGMIQILDTPSTAGVVDGDALTVDYTAAPLTGATALDVLHGATRPQLTGTLFFKSDNVTGPNYDAQVWQATLKPDGDLGLITTEFAKMNFALTALDDSAGAHGGSVASPFFDKVIRG